MSKELAEDINELRVVVKELQERTAPKPIPWWKFFGLISLFIGVIWSAARLPTRDEFSSNQAKVQDIQFKQIQTASDIVQIRDTLVRMEKHQEMIDLKLDSALQSVYKDDK